jgi:DNA-binding transcriptional MocR family regulator
MSFPSEPPAPFLRLSYSAAEPPALIRAVQILAEVLAAS